MPSLYSLSGSAPFDSGGLALKIVEALKQYKTPLPLEFVAKLADLPPKHILPVVKELEAQQIVSIDGNDLLSLVGQIPKASGLFGWLTK